MGVATTEGVHSDAMITEQKSSKGQDLSKTTGFATAC
jgi:hypothetical protein